MNAEKEQRLAWWREARFGMTITWGLYALKGAGEWVQSSVRVVRQPSEGKRGIHES